MRCLLYVVGQNDFDSVGVSILITGLPYGNPSRKMGRFLRFIIFRVGKSIACHSPAKWCLCANYSQAIQESKVPPYFSLG